MKKISILSVTIVLSIFLGSFSVLKVFFHVGIFNQLGVSSQDPHIFTSECREQQLKELSVKEHSLN